MRKGQKRTKYWASNLTHGHARKGQMSPTYRCWKHMIARCTDPNDPRFSTYGMRGISVCAEWMSFENFLSSMGEKPKDLSLDRIDVNGIYEPSNCRWATSEQQANNKTNSHLITWEGQTMTVAEWAKKLGIPYARFRRRVERGWPIEKVFTQPYRKSPNPLPKDVKASA